MTDISQSYEVYPGKIELQFQMKPVSLHVDMAIPCALLLNELTSNTLKYAFPDDNTRKMLIRIEEEPSKKLHLLFKDNGVGLSDSIEIKHVDNFGLRLVRVLTQQLIGKLELERDAETSFSFHFPITSP